MKATAAILALLPLLAAAAPSTDVRRADTPEVIFIYAPFPLNEGPLPFKKRQVVVTTKPIPFRGPCPAAVPSLGKGSVADADAPVAKVTWATDFPANRFPLEVEFKIDGIGHWLATENSIKQIDGGTKGSCGPVPVPLIFPPPSCDREGTKVQNPWVACYLGS